MRHAGVWGPSDRDGEIFPAGEVSVVDQTAAAVEGRVEVTAAAKTTDDGEEGFNIEKREGPPEEDDGEKELSRPSPVIFGFHAVPSTSPCNKPKNATVTSSPEEKAIDLNVERNKEKKEEVEDSDSYNLSLDSVEAETKVEAQADGNAKDEKDETSKRPEVDITQDDIVLDDEGDSETNKEKWEEEPKDEQQTKSGRSGLTCITPSVLAAVTATTSSEDNAGCGKLSTDLSMRSTVLVEDASGCGSDKDDATMIGEKEDEGEDEYEMEGEYDGSIADESEEHFANAASSRNKPLSPRNDTKKKRRSKVNEKLLRDGHRQACRYLKAADFARALKEFEGILDELTTSLGDSHRRVGSALHNVGIVNIRAENLDDAVDALEEAIRIRKDVHGPDHPKVADSLLELGIALLSQKEYEDALEIFNDALEIRENDLAEEVRHGSNEDRIHCVLQVAKALNNIACVYFEYGSLSKALKTLEDVLAMQKEAIDELTDKDPDYKQAKLSLATTFCNIGYVHADNKDWDDAIEFLDRAYVVSEHVC